jgi:hypothetical protein
MDGSSSGTFGGARGDTGDLGELCGETLGEVWGEKARIEGAQPLYAGGGDEAGWHEREGDVAGGGGSWFAEGSMRFAAGAGSLAGLISHSALPPAGTIGIVDSIFDAFSDAFSELLSCWIALITSAIVGRTEMSTAAHRFTRGCNDNGMVLWLSRLLARQSTTHNLPHDTFLRCSIAFSDNASWPKSGDRVAIRTHMHANAYTSTAGVQDIWATSSDSLRTREGRISGAR